MTPEAEICRADRLSENETTGTRHIGERLSSRYAIYNASLQVPISSSIQSDLHFAQGIILRFIIITAFVLFPNNKCSIITLTKGITLIIMR